MAGSALRCWLALAGLGAGALVALSACESVGPEPVAPTRVSLARSLARSDARMSDVLARSRFDAAGRFAATDESVVVQLPERADGWVELRPGSRARPLARFRTLSIEPRELRLDSGVAVYESALGGVDLLYAATADLVEQLFVVQRSEHFAFAWELCVRSDLIEARAGGALRFQDARGDERLHIPEPYAIDAHGTRRNVSVKSERLDSGCFDLRFELDARGLRAPILVDPALEVVAWQKKSVAAGAPRPSPRFEHGLAWDPVRKVTVLFGGRSTFLSEPLRGDTWEWDGSEWVEKQPAQSPQPRAGFGMVYSPLHGAVVLHGGAAGTTISDAEANGETWKYDGTTWSLLPPGGPALFGHELGFDAKRNVVVLCGGRDVGTFNNAVWELGATSWSGPIEPPIPLGPLTYFAMTYDAAIERTVLFGGFLSELFQEGTDATWGWDGAKFGALAAGPAIRWDIAAAFDTKRNRSIYFGGANLNGDVKETWELSQAHGWEQRAPLTQPYEMSAARATYDAARDRVVLFGGWTFFAMGDTFEYVRFGNTCSVDADCDGYPCVDGVCCSVESCGPCESCTASTGLCGPVLGMDDPDSCAGALTCDPSGACKKDAGEACSAPADCASGFCSSGVCCNAPCTASCESCGVSGSVGTCSLVVGSAAHGSCPGSGACGSSCDGKSPECSFAPAGSDCGTSCDGIELVTRTCDGEGTCVSSAPTACELHYSCASGASCNTTCTGDSHCAPGFFCFDGVCSDGKAVCKDDVTSQDPGGNQTDCRPFRCQDRECLKVCSSSADCAPGASCTSDQRCLPRPGSPDADDSGCGCRLAPHPEPSSRLALFALAAALLLRRRAA